MKLLLSERNFSSKPFPGNWLRLTYGYTSRSIALLLVFASTGSITGCIGNGNYRLPVTFAGEQSIQSVNSNAAVADSSGSELVTTGASLPPTTIRSQDAVLPGGWSGLTNNAVYPNPNSDPPNQGSLVTVGQTSATVGQTAHLTQPVLWSGNDPPNRSTLTNRVSQPHQPTSVSSGHSFAGTTARLRTPRFPDGQQSLTSSPQTASQGQFARQDASLSQRFGSIPPSNANPETTISESASIGPVGNDSKGIQKAAAELGLDVLMPELEVARPTVPSGLKWQAPLDQAPDAARQTQNAVVTSPTVEFKEPAATDTSSTEAISDSATLQLQPALPNPAEATANREPTMMERIRDLYSPRGQESTADERATELIRKPFRRLQSPWGLLRPREETSDAAIAAQRTGSLDDISGVEDPAASQPVAEAPDAAFDRSSLLQILITELENQAAAWPKSENGTPANIPNWRRLQTDLRLLNLIDDNAAAATAAIDGLPSAEKEFWQSLTLAMSAYRDSSDPTLSEQDRFLASSEQLRAAVRQLQILSPLVIRRMTFCSRISSFGSVDAFPTSDFNPGQPVLIYAELDNFESERSSAGTYRSLFTARVEVIRSNDSEPVEVIEVGQLQDESTSPRTDYFQSYELTIPQLAVGKYTLRLVVQDELSGQHAHSSLPFYIR